MNLKRLLKKFNFFYCVNAIWQFINIRLKKLLLYVNNAKFNNYFSDSLEHSLSIIKALRGPAMQPEYNNYDEKSIYDLSIIVPIYNAELFLKECLSSISKQITKYSLQVICVNDGSTDNSIKILDEYKNDKRFLIINQENRGHSGARNRALSIALGKYIMFVDSDDFLSENYVEQMLNMANNSTSDIILGPYIKCNAKSKKLRSYRYKAGRYNNFMEYIQFDGAPWGKIYKRELWKEVFFPEGMMFEDTIIFNVLLRRSNSITVCDNVYYFYRIHGNNTVDQLRKNNDVRMLDSLWSIFYSLDLADRLCDRTIDYFSFLLLQCSVHLYYRIKAFNLDVQMAVFNLIQNKVNCYYNRLNRPEIIFQDIVLKNIFKAFLTHNFGLWKECSEVYPSNNIKVNKNYKVILMGKDYENICRNDNI